VKNHLGSAKSADKTGIPRFAFLGAKAEIMNQADNRG